MKTLSILLLCIYFLSACDSKVKEENATLLTKIENLKIENDSLIEGNMKITSSIESYKQTLDEINKNLAAIDEAGSLVKKLTPEGEAVIEEDVKESIKQHIANISALLDNSRLKIITLDKNLSNLRKISSDKSEEILMLEEKIQELSNLILMKNQDLFDLEDDLNEEIDFLDMMLDIEKDRSAELFSILNRAYYISGTSKQLKEMGIIKKEGGFIGLGQVKVLNATAPSTLFSEIKKDQTVILGLNCKKATLITSHPESSYSFRGDTDVISGLTIDNPKEFWKNSNYLVIETKE